MAKQLRDVSLTQVYEDGRRAPPNAYTQASRPRRARSPGRLPHFTHTRKVARRPAALVMVSRPQPLRFQVANWRLPDTPLGCSGLRPRNVRGINQACRAACKEP